MIIIFRYIFLKLAAISIGLYQTFRNSCLILIVSNTFCRTAFVYYLGFKHLYNYRVFIFYVLSTATIEEYISLTIMFFFRSIFLWNDNLSIIANTSINKSVFWLSREWGQNINPVHPHAHASRFFSIMSVQIFERKNVEKCIRQLCFARPTAVAYNLFLHTDSEKSSTS